MRFAAMADIHGNAGALKAVLDDIAHLGIRDVVNLGDCFSGPMDADQVGDLLLLVDAAGENTVRGNHDRYLLQTPLADMGLSDRHARQRLAERHMDWLRHLPVTRVWRNDIFLCHATPSADDVYWLERVTEEGDVVMRPQAEIEALADGIEQSLILCGHSHTPRIVQLADGRLVVNPGSVGCPAYRDEEPVPHRVETGNPLASYAIMEKDGHGWSVVFRAIPYDHMAASRLAASNGRAEWAEALATGRI